MNLEAPAPELSADDCAFSPDRRLNDLCNRLTRQIGPRSADEIATLALLAVTARGWAEGFAGLAATARAEGREFAAEHYERAADSLTQPCGAVS